MLKLRLMGSKEDIQWFNSLLSNTPGLDIMSISDFYANSGTSKYYRCYAEIENTDKIAFTAWSIKTDDVGKREK